MSEPRQHDHRFSHNHRLHGRSAFGSVYAHRLRKHAGPLTAYGKPNDLPHCRLGLSVSRRVGIAVVRTRIKRMLREAFRLTQQQRPLGYDLVIVVHAHAPATLDQYKQWLIAAADAIDRQSNQRTP